MTPTDKNSSESRRMSPHFFQREADGSVRLRIRLTAEEASQIEEGAGQTPLMLYIHRILKERSAYHIRKRDEQLQRQQQAINDGNTTDPDEEGVDDLINQR